MHAINLDPDNARAHAGLATAHTYQYFWDGLWETLEKGVKSAERAVQLDRNEPEALSALSLTLTKSGRSEEGVRFAEQAAKLLPGSVIGIALLGVALVHMGRHDEARQHLLCAIQLDPHIGDWTHEFLGQTYYFSHRFEEAVSVFERIIEPPSWVCGYHAASCAMSGDDSAARELVNAYVRLVHDESNGQDGPEEQMGADLEDISRYKRPEDLELMVAGYRKAGLPIL
ncbi:MAG: hypothetical protein P8Q36_14280 [Alphaproteobacteria bacterium]|nr:tetratricopeptide repeat protein [Rhodospirillaceae bacterium]MBT6510117.1 tetratricopeptide repeat protein [Rhodospirillaceae bacterium]MBT7612675.1 tetratricopeptide repeat protein [Rhodospirillaceae bacterium]MBT7648601.1 tetratricopeptide repeat protein [Rhodospirillaceae bacterium]MDG2482013.1 hypothetical protein [Alphaproteobacteria bacterium]